MSQENVTTGDSGGGRRPQSRAIAGYEVAYRRWSYVRSGTRRVANGASRLADDRQVTERSASL